MHASVHYRLGGYNGSSSHNNDAWISEVNRLAPLLGFRNVEAGRQVPKRVAIPGEFTKTGKPATKVQKVSLGNVPFAAAAMLGIFQQTYVKLHGDSWKCFSDWLLRQSCLPGFGERSSLCFWVRGQL